MRGYLSFLRRSAYVAGLVALVAAVARLASPAPPPRSLEGLAHMLGTAVGGTVAQEEIAWEASAGFLTEALFGRRLVFLAASNAGRRDLYRAWVRVSLDGKPISVTQLKNLTKTPLGDDAGLRLAGHRAAVATMAYGRIQAVSIFDLSGVRPEDRPSAWTDRVLLGLSSLGRTGSAFGVGRTDVIFELPAHSATLTLEPSTLHVDLGVSGREVVVDLEKRVASSADGGEAYAVRVVPHRHGEKPFIIWAVDAVRDVVGPTPIAWLEKHVFGVRDAFKRTAYSLFSTGEPSLSPQAAAKRIIEVEASFDDAVEAWPPPPVPSLWTEPEPGEGEWQPVTLPWLASHPKTTKAPPYFYRTFIRPDPERPYAEVLLIAMDMRRLKLDVEAGYEDPEPLTGPPGAGRIPQDPAIQRRVVATFNGAFKTTHGEYGMMVNRRVLVPPTPGAATVVVTHDGETGFGNWPRSKQLPGNVVSFRQNLDPLLEDGIVNPTGRYVWGWQLAGQGVLTERTAICLSKGRHIYYAWGQEISGPRLAEALRQAGCDYAVHLDMNPKHCGFVFTNIRDTASEGLTVKLAHPDMSINPNRYALWSQKDFFYVTLRDLDPEPIQKQAWQPSSFQQPPPSWLPGIFRATVRVGGIDVELHGFEKGRLDWLVRAGRSELEVPDRRPKKYGIDEREAARTLIALGLGHTTDATRYGLVFEGEPSIDLRNAYASVVLGPDKALRIEAPGKVSEIAPGADVVQLPLLAEAGEALTAAGHHGAMRPRGALCVTPFGRVLYGEVRHDSTYPVVLALVRAGCQRVVATDRGSGHPAFMHVAGSSTPPLSDYETTVLYALGRPMTPHAFRWRPKGSERATKPTGHDSQPVSAKSTSKRQAR